MVLARWQRTITDNSGNVLPSASVQVNNEVGGGLASLFSDRAGATPIGNPFTADSTGFAAFHVAGGSYSITATSGSFSKQWRYVGIGLASETDGGTFSTTADMTVTGTWNFAGGTATTYPITVTGGGPGIVWNSTDSRNSYTGTI